MVNLYILAGISALVIFIVIAYIISRSDQETSLDGNTGIVIPLFNNYRECNDWNIAISTKENHPDVPMIAIINPASGSGGEKDGSINEGTSKLKSAGIKVIGYVSTRYSMRDYEEVIREIDNYYLWYNVDGIFFDEVSHWPGSEEYYINAVKHVNSKVGSGITIGNPGTGEGMPNYKNVFDVLVIYESYGIPAPSSLETHGNDRERLAVFSFGIDSLEESDVKNLTEKVGWIFITQGVMPNPWNSLPPYFESLLNMVE